MSSIAPVNIQHIVQVATATEKLQHTLQNIPHTNGQHNEEERKIIDEKKRLSVQDPEIANQSNTVNPEGSKGKRPRRDNNPSDLEKEEDTNTKKIAALENKQGKTIDLVV